VAGGVLAGDVPVSSVSLLLLHPRTTRRIAIFTTISGDKLRQHMLASMLCV
jgi:hypothetical protein